MNPCPFTPDPENIPEFRYGVEKFITRCLEPWDVEYISFEKDLDTGTWETECDKTLPENDRTHTAIEWFCYHLDKYRITDYILRNLNGIAWQSVCIRDGYPERDSDEQPKGENP